MNIHFLTLYLTKIWKNPYSYILSKSVKENQENLNRRFQKKKKLYDSKFRKENIFCLQKLYGFAVTVWIKIILFRGNRISGKT